MKEKRKRRVTVVGLKSDKASRQLLLRVLILVVRPGDSVLSVHVEEKSDIFNPNTFLTHEDLCRSKQVDFQVKICLGSSFISELTRQARENNATFLAIGCSSTVTGSPKSRLVESFLEILPPTCSLLVLDNAGRILTQTRVNSRRNATSESEEFEFPLPPSSTAYACSDQYLTNLTVSSLSSSVDNKGLCNIREKHFTESSNEGPPDIVSLLKETGFRNARHFTEKELKLTTQNFSPWQLIGKGGNSMVYRATLDDGRAVAVKLLKATKSSTENFVQEVKLLVRVQHENIVQLIGYCCSKNIKAIVYKLLEASLKQELRQLKWDERMSVAIDIAKALEYMHHVLDPPVVHRDVKSSNILLSKSYKAQLSDFGAALIYDQSEPLSTRSKDMHIVGTFGYLAPEYVMYGKVDEKIDVYSFGVVLLELITGQDVIRTNMDSKHQSLVVWAKPVLSSNRYESLIDPDLNDDYNREEMRTLIIAARLCLLPPSSGRPSMRTIVKLLEEEGYWLKEEKERDGFFSYFGSDSDICFWRNHQDNPNTREFFDLDS